MKKVYEKYIWDFKRDGYGYVETRDHNEDLIEAIKETRKQTLEEVQGWISHIADSNIEFEHELEVLNNKIGKEIDKLEKGEAL